MKVKVLDYKRAYDISLENFKKYLSDFGFNYEEEWGNKSKSFSAIQMMEAFGKTEWYGHESPIVTFHCDYDFVTYVIEYYKVNYGIVPYIRKDEYNENPEFYIREYIDVGVIGYE